MRAELGQGFNLAGLEAAYGVGQSRGLFVSPQLLAYQQEQAKKQEQKPVENTGMASWQQAPPPTVGRSTQQGTSSFADLAEGMDFETLERELRKKAPEMFR